MPPAARIGDLHLCPGLEPGAIAHIGGPIVMGQANVLIGGLPAARVGDQALCVGPPDSISEGSETVLIGGLPAARLGDPTEHGGVVVLGSMNVLIG